MRHGALLSAVSAALLFATAGCSQAVSTPAHARADRPLAGVLPARTKAAAPSAGQARVERQVGDFWVHRISGTFSSKAMLLVERVVGKDDAGFTVEYTLEDSEGSSRLLVWRDATNGVIVGVARVVDGKQEPGSIADYEELMAKTTFVPDSNEGYVDRTLGTCLVGPSELDCETKSYRVRIGDREANLDITRSDKYPGRDIGGEISTNEGEVIYRAELLESGHDGSLAPGTARAER